MGIDTITLIAKEDVKKLDFFTLMNMSEKLRFGRYYRFRECFNLPDDVWEISLEDLITHLATTSKVSQEYRDNIISFVGYDIIFIADSGKWNEEKYVSVRGFLYSAVNAALDLAKKGMFPKDG